MRTAPPVLSEDAAPHVTLAAQTQAARRATIQLVAASDDLRSSRLRLAHASGVSR